MPAALEAWFGTVEVVRDGDAPFDPQQRYMFGYTPHGLFPIGANCCDAAEESRGHFCMKRLRSSRVLSTGYSRNPWARLSAVAACVEGIKSWCTCCFDGT